MPERSEDHRRVEKRTPETLRIRRTVAFGRCHAVEIVHVHAYSNNDLLQVRDACRLPGFFPRLEKDGKKYGGESRHYLNYHQILNEGECCLLSYRRGALYNGSISNNSFPKVNGWIV